MTTKVYIRGDVGDPSNCYVVDAHTDQVVPNVQSMQITVDPVLGCTVDARLLEDDGKGNMVPRGAQWDLVPEHGGVTTTTSGVGDGEELMRVALKVRDAPTRSMRTFELVAQCYTVSGRTLVPLPGKTLSGRAEIADMDMALASDPVAMQKAAVEGMGVNLGQAIALELFKACKHVKAHPAVQSKQRQGPPPWRDSDVGTMVREGSKVVGRLHGVGPGTYVQVMPKAGRVPVQILGEKLDRIFRYDGQTIQGKMAIGVYQHSGGTQLMGRGRVTGVVNHPDGRQDITLGDGNGTEQTFPHYMVNVEAGQYVTPGAKYSHTGSRMVQDAIDKVGSPRGAQIDVCQECKGTGFYTSPISGAKSPCSMGCKP